MQMLKLLRHSNQCAAQCSKRFASLRAQLLGIAEFKLAESEFGLGRFDNAMSLHQQVHSIMSNATGSNSKLSAYANMKFSESARICGKSLTTNETSSHADNLVWHNIDTCLSSLLKYATLQYSNACLDKTQNCPQQMLDFSICKRELSSIVSGVATVNACSFDVREPLKGSFLGYAMCNLQPESDTHSITQSWQIQRYQRVSVTDIPDKLPQSSIAAMESALNQWLSAIAQIESFPEFSSAAATVTAECSEVTLMWVKWLAALQCNCAEAHEMLGAHSKSEQCLKHALTTLLPHKEVSVMRPYVGRVMSLMAGAHVRAGQSVTAEGLYRGALEHLTCSAATHDLRHQYEHWLCMGSYGRLLSRWDRREAHGQALVQEANAKIQALPWLGGVHTARLSQHLVVPDLPALYDFYCA